MRLHHVAVRYMDGPAWLIRIWGLYYHMYVYGPTWLIGFGGPY